MHNPANGMVLDAPAPLPSPATPTTNVESETVAHSVARQVLAVVHPVLEAVLGRIRDLELQVAAGRGRATEQTPRPEHHTPDSRAVAPQSLGHVRPSRPNEVGHVSPCPAAPPPTSRGQVSPAVEGCAAAPTNPVGQQKDTSGSQPPEVAATPLADAPPPPTTADAFPALPSRGRLVAAPVPPTFAGVLTAGGYRDGMNARAFAKAAKVASSPPSSQGPKTTRFVVLRDGGVSDERKERALREGDPPVGCTIADRYKSSAARIVLALCTDIEKNVADPIRILDGSWCRKVSCGGPPKYTGNFSITLAGDVPFATITPYTKFFAKHLLRAALVPVRSGSTPEFAVSPFVLSTVPCLASARS